MTKPIFWTSAATIALLASAGCRTSDSIVSEAPAELTGDTPDEIAAVEASTELAPASDAYVQQLLTVFDQSPTTAMDADIEKFDRRGGPREEMPLFFTSDAIAGKDFVNAKDQWRVLKILCAKQAHPENCLTATGAQAAIQPNDKPANLVDNSAQIVVTLEQMEAQNLKSARLPTSPWSDDYWAIYTGVLGKRYADPNFPESDDWKENRDYVLGTVPAANVADVNLLSPAEKYDLLVGDPTFSLTKSQWAEGQTYYERSGSVETWMGICHGWSPAAYMLPRPVRTVTLKGANGQSIQFYPSDIKALGTGLFAKGAVESKFIGGRCNDKNPTKDANGRVTAQQCFDNNPGAWHTAIVNQLGVAKRSMVLDATYDYEVWNQPLLGYRYRYFNPKTKQLKNSIADATEALPMAGDKFTSYRGAQSKKLVGVAMDVWYVVETNPSQEATDSEDMDAVTRVTYTYDLELDAQGKIVGGEWYTNKHPDFLWTPAKAFKVQTAGDTQATGAWNPAAPLPQTWRTAGRADAKRGMPLGKLVYQLYQQAAAP